MTVLIAGYARTPLVRFTGAFAGQSATTLGGHAVSAALERAGISPADVDQVIAGQVLQAGCGQNPARQTAVNAGIGLTVPAITINAVCLSGAEAVTQAARLIRAGEAEVVVAVGQESMSQAPHVANLRPGIKYGTASFVDTVDHDGLTDAFEKTSMGTATDPGNAALDISRADQDAFAARSHQLAQASAEFFAGEIAPVTLASRRGETVIDADDGIRPGTTTETLAGLRPAFTPDGTITAGNASQITDGAAAMVLVSSAAAERLGLTPSIEVEASAFVAGPDVSLHSQPSQAILAALAKLADVVLPADLAAIEINEAFASVAIQSIRDLGVDPDRVNPHGGAIALGHPIGASGVRITGTLARQLESLEVGQRGAIGICGGGGQGSAIILRRV